MRPQFHLSNGAVLAMTRLTPLVIPLLAAQVASAQGAKYPPLSAYFMTRDAEMALAMSAAPANISSQATIKLLAGSGYQVAREGQNGFICMVMRGWSAPTFTPVPFRDIAYDATVRAPICFDPTASRTVLPYYEMRSALAMEGRTPDQIAEGIQAAYARGKLPERTGVSFAYMWSADQLLGPPGHWHPHMMVFSPYYTNAMVGGHTLANPFPLVIDDEGTPFAVVVIPVDDRLAIKSQPR
jgi:hypothetical protein